MTTTSATISFACIWLQVTAHAKYEVSEAATKGTIIVTHPFVVFSLFLIVVYLHLYCDGMQLSFDKETHVCHLAAQSEAVI